MAQKIFGKDLKVWSKAEERKLVSLYWEGEHIDEIAKRLHRSRCAVTHRQHRLNIKGRKRVETEETKAKARDRLNELRKKDKRRWTIEQTELLLSLYPSAFSLKRIAQKLGKSERAILVQASRKGLRRRKEEIRKWDESEIKTLCLLYPSEFAIKKIMDLMNRSEESIRRQANRLKLKRVKRIMTPEAKENRRQGILNTPKERERRSKRMREYNLTKKDYSTPWNVGKHPWEWMNITEEAFYKLIFEAQKRKPTSIEKRLSTIIKTFNLPYRYVGDGEIWINGKCPDFINTNNEKKLIEVQGDYWHTKEEAKDRGEFFKHYGFKTLFIWESEMKVKTDKELSETIRKFS